MNRLTEMTVGARLGIGFGALLTLMVLLIAVSLANMARIKQSMDTIVYLNKEKTEHLHVMSEAVYQVGKSIRNLLLVNDDQSKERELAEIAAARTRYDTAWTALTALSADADATRHQTAVVDVAATARPLDDQVVALAMDGRVLDAQMLLTQEADAVTARWQSLLDEYVAHQKDRTAADVTAAVSAYENSRRLLLFLGVFAAVTAVALTLFLVRSLTSQLGGEPQAAAEVAKRIAEGDYESPIVVKGTNLRSLMASMKLMQKQLRDRAESDRLKLEESLRVSEEALRIKNALDKCSTNVMIADHQRQVIYLNESMQQMLSANEAEIRRAIPDFESKRVLGSPAEWLHHDAARQASQIERLSATQKDEIQIAQLTLGMTLSPILNEKGERLGTVVEWTDRTAEVLVEAEVSGIVAAAAAGDFLQRVKVEGKQGFFKLLAESINTLMETSHIGLNEVARVLGSLAQGDLTQQVEGDFRGTFGKLKDDANQTVAQLTQIITQIKQATDTINTASKEIASGNSDLSARTEQQAASLEETASSMEELTSTVKQNAENAKQANQLAVGASDVARKGGSVVSEVVTTMSAINESSKKIVDIISVIDGIAFQTNILALNAAVEAARAGEQGRGFAVVASEVRSLAQRSAAAAKEIKGLIGDSVEKVGNGAKLVDQAGKTMEEIVTSVKRVTDIMAEISAASQEQSQGIEQVNQTITQMDEVTQQNAGLVEEANAAARSMAQQADELRQAVSRFRFSGTADARSAGGTPPRPASAASIPLRKAAPKSPSADAPPAEVRRRAQKAADGALPRIRGGEAAPDAGAWAQF